MNLAVLSAQVQRWHRPWLKPELANASLLEVSTAEVTRLLGLDGQTCVLAPLDKTLDVLREVVELEIAFPSLTGTVGHAATRHLAGGKGVR